MRLKVRLQHREWGDPPRKSHNVKQPTLIYICSFLFSSLLAGAPPTTISPRPDPGQTARLEADDGEPKTVVRGGPCLCRACVHRNQICVLSSTHRGTLLKDILWGSSSQISSIVRLQFFPQALKRPPVERAAQQRWGASSAAPSLDTSDASKMEAL